MGEERTALIIGYGNKRVSGFFDFRKQTFSEINCGMYI